VTRPDVELIILDLTFGAGAAIAAGEGAFKCAAARPVDLRNVTGIELLSQPTLSSKPPPLEVKTIEPAVSPGVVGVAAVTSSTALWPGASSKNDGETLANGTKLLVDTRRGTTPFIPPSEAKSPKMTPVQLAGGG